ncbi:MAG: iron-siderophore ABC transporter substrate-binding protein [Cyanobacteria bacterium P01_C01_bin.72]
MRNSLPITYYLTSARSRNFCRRFASLIVAGILSVTLTVACRGTNQNLSSTPTSNQDCREVEHVMGKTCIPLDPQRVITLHPNPLANSLALGIQPIAAAFYRGVPVLDIIQETAPQIESVGDLSNPSIEKILLLEPDLIISYSSLENIYPQLSQIAPTVVLNLTFPYPSWKEQLAELAGILDNQSAYQQLMADYRQRIYKLQERLGDRPSDLNISVAGIASGIGVWTYGAKHPLGDILGDLGVSRPAIQQGDYFFYENISEEKLSVLDGDVLFLSTWDRDEDQLSKEKLRQKPLWQKLEVVRKNQVYFVGRYWHNSGHMLSVNAILDDLEHYLLD